MSALERYQPPRSLGEIERLAGHFASSGLFGRSPQTQSEIIVKMIAGAENGFPPFASVQGVHIIQGRPEVGADLLARAVKQSGRYDFRVREISDERCVIEFFQDGESIGVSPFSQEDAKQAGLAGKDNYKRFPRNMLYARAMSNGVGWFCPDAVSTRLYVDGEINGQHANGALVGEIVVEPREDDDGPGSAPVPAEPYPPIPPTPSERVPVPEQPPEPSPGGLTPHEIVSEGLAALTSDERKRLKAHLERMRIAPEDKRVKQGWLDAIIDNFSGDYEDAPLYEQLPALLAALDEQHALANEKREPDATPLERRDALDERSDRELESLLPDSMRDVQSLPMYGEGAPS